MREPGDCPTDFVPRFQEFPEPPVVFVIKEYYDGLCSVQDCPATTGDAGQRLQDAKRTHVPSGDADVMGVNGSVSGGYVLTADSVCTRRRPTS